MTRASFAPGARAVRTFGPSDKPSTRPSKRPLGRTAKALVTSRPSSNTRTFATFNPAGILTARSASPALITSALFDRTSIPRLLAPLAGAAHHRISPATSDAVHIRRIRVPPPIDLPRDTRTGHQVNECSAVGDC